MKKIIALVDDFIGLNPKEVTELIEKGVKPGGSYPVKNVNLEGEGYTATVIVEGNEKTEEAELKNGNVSLFCAYDLDDIRTYDPRKDKELIKPAEKGG